MKRSKISLFLLNPNYIQYISIGSGSACEVPIGGTSCTIEVGSIKASDTDELLGSRDITITANSKNNYFAPPESKSLLLTGIIGLL